MVGRQFQTKLSSQNLRKREDLPTPWLPTITTLKRKSYYFIIYLIKRLGPATNIKWQGPAYDNSADCCLPLIALINNSYNNKAVRTMEEPSKPPPYDIQSNWSNMIECLLHRAANSYGMPLNYRRKCVCCGKLAEKERLGCNFPLVKIYYCGAQLPSYLLTLKYISLLLLLLCLINAMPLMMMNHEGKACEKRIQCSSSFLLSYSVFNQFGHRKKIITEAYIVFANYIICTIFCHFLRRNLRKVRKEIDEADLFPSQFAVFCRAPLQALKRRRIEEAIQKWWKLQAKYNRNQIKSLFPQLIAQNPSLSHSSRNSTQQALLSSHLIEQIIHFKTSPNKLTKDDAKEQQGKATKQKQKQKQKQNVHSSSWLIIFKSKHYANYFYSKNSPSIFEKLTCFQKFRHVYVSQAQISLIGQLYPSQIYWQNSIIGGIELLKQGAYSVCALTGLMIMGSGFVFLLSYLNREYIQSNQNKLHQYYYIITSFTINTLILIGNLLIKALFQQQKYSFYPTAKTSFVYKIVIFNLTLLIISPIIILLCLGPQLLWQSNGLAQTQTLTLLIYVLFYHFKRYLSPQTIKLVKGYYNLHGEGGMSQKEANGICNRPPHCLEQEYSSVLTILFFTLFMSSFLPFISIMGFASLVLHYWVQKANIAYFYNEDQPHSHLLSLKMVELVELSLSMILLGNFIAYIISNSLFQEQFNVLLIFLYSVSFLYAILSLSLPQEKINAKIFSYFDPSEGHGANNSNQYTKAKNTFLTFFESYQNEQQKRSDSSSTSERQGKAEEQLRSIEASLSVSLRERLVQRQMPIIRQGVNDGYFEYQRKINMRKTEPKVAIPPLFKKDTNLRRQGNARLQLSSIGKRR